MLEGLKKVDRRKEQAFVRGEPITAETEEPEAPKTKSERKEKRERAKAAKLKPEPKDQREGEERAPATAPPPIPTITGLMPLSSRIRTDLGTALKRASLERQLAKVTPNTIQDILEEALEPWLKDKGYLRD